MKEVSFGKDFKWGSASSGPQSEGSKNKVNKSCWDAWFENEPERFYEFIGPEVTTDVYNQYETDAKLMNEIGLNSFRTSIQWSRMIKDFKTGEPDPDAIEFYTNYFKALKENGVHVVVNLYHFDIPIVLHEEYEGLLSREVVDMFVEYAKTCFSLFDEYVDMWTTFNEPMGYAREAYHNNRIFPCELNFTKMMQLNYNSIITNALCVKAHRSMELDSEYGIILDCLTPYARSQAPEDLEAARIADLLTNKIYLDPCIKGDFDQEYYDFIKQNDIKVEVFEGDKELIANNIIDFVGINYYRPIRVKAPTTLKHDNTPLLLDHFFEEYEMPNCRMNHYRGWEIYPRAMYEIGMRMKEEYGNKKWFISESGMGVANEDRFRNSDGMIEDDYRIDFLTEHLYWLNKAMQDGSNCFGFHIWTFVDNWSWINSYKNRYGYVEYNIDTKERRRKKSSYWIEDVIKNDKLKIGGYYGEHE